MSENVVLIEKSFADAIAMIAAAQDDEHAHRRLGFAAETVTQWLEAAGLDIVREQTLPPEPQGKIAVSLWLARDPRVALAEPATTLEVA
jgi:hypothetical protein